MEYRFFADQMDIDAAAEYLAHRNAHFNGDVSFARGEIEDQLRGLAFDIHQGNHTIGARTMGLFIYVSYPEHSEDNEVTFEIYVVPRFGGMRALREVGPKKFQLRPAVSPQLTKSVWEHLRTKT